MELAAENKLSTAQHYSPTSTPVLDVFRPLPPQSKENLSAGEYFFGSSLVILALVGLPSLRAAIEIAPGYWAAAVPFVAVVGSGIVHETGHIFAALLFGYACPRFWKLGRAQANYKVTMDSNGAMFNLGTKKQPSDLFLAWDQIAAIRHKRVGNAQQYWVIGRDGSEARFSSYTVFRPKKVARLIAERTGLAIQEA